MRQGRKDHQRPSKQLGQPYTARTVARHVAANAVVLVIGLPLALWGIVTHGVPDRLTGVAVRWLERTVEEEATYKIVAGALLYPVCWVLEGWGVRRLFGGWGLALFVLLLVPSGLLALAWRDRLARATSGAGLRPLPRGPRSAPVAARAG